ncbi:hypothetical protein LX36DRAFT_91417 [Colletotrichum falcatum]|nr:hypothetical protein LX36DRAFT_91417 [Colletotrichum falcatum]
MTGMSVYRRVDLTIKFNSKLFVFIGSVPKPPACLVTYHGGREGAIPSPCSAGWPLLHQHSLESGQQPAAISSFKGMRWIKREKPCELPCRWDYPAEGALQRGRWIPREMAHGRPGLGLHRALLRVCSDALAKAECDLDVHPALERLMQEAKAQEPKPRWLTLSVLAELEQVACGVP